MSFQAVAGRTAVFDLDGTLADTAADMIEGANARFRALGLGDLLDPVADAPVGLRGGKAMLRAGFARAGAGGEPEVEREYPLLLVAYAEVLDRTSRLYPGAAEAVEGLRGAGWRVAVCTNKPAALAERLMVSLGLRGLFDALAGADTFAFRKPDPRALVETVRRAGGDPDRAIMVGDTETDLTAARAAGVPCVLVGFGPEGAGIARLAPEAVLDHYDDLIGIAGRLLPG